MMPRFGINRVAAALTWRFAVALAAGAALFIASTISLMRSPTDRTAFGSANAAANGQPGGEAVAAAATSFPTIAAYPLFYPSRMPWVPPAPPPPAPVSTAPSPLTNYALVGVVVSGDTRSALIRPPGATKIITLVEGQELGGWKLQEITRTQLRFAAGDASYEMKFLKPSESAR
jgi:hypothetical protein